MRSPGLRRVATPAEFRLDGRPNSVRDAARIIVRCDSAIAGEGRRGALRAPEGAYAAPVRAREPWPGVGVGGVSRRVPDGCQAARGDSMRGPGLRRVEFRLGGRLNPVRDAARILVRCSSGIAGEGRRGALRAPEGAYAASVRVREPSPGLRVGGVSRRVSDGGQAARGGSVRGPGLRRVEFRLGGPLNAVRDAARIIVGRDGAIAGEWRRGALRAPEGAYAASVRAREPWPGSEVGGVSRRVCDGGQAARGGSVRGPGLRRVEFGLGGGLDAVRDAARIIVRCDSAIGEGRRGVLRASEGAYAASVRARELGSGVCPGVSPTAVRPPVGIP